MRSTVALHRLIPLLSASLLALGLVVVPAPQPAAAQALPSNPKLYLTPDCFTADGVWQITVSGRNFDRNRQVTVNDYVYYGTSGQKADATATVTTDNYGVFSTTLSVTADTYYYSNHVGAAYTDDPTGVEVASTFIGGPCTGAEAKIVPPCGDGKAAVLHVVGTGWAPPPADAPIDVKLFVNLGGQVGNTTTIDATASFDLQFSPGVDLDPGDYQLVISQNSADGKIENYQQLPYTVPCAQLSIKPDCAQAGAPPDRLSIAVSGAGFVAHNGSEGDGQVEIVFDPTGEPQEYFYSNGQGLPADGSFGPLEINPYARPKGTYTIEVLQHYGPGIVRDQTLSFNVPCFVPTITADPICGPPQIVGDAKNRYAVNVAGSGFAPQAEVTVVFDVDLAAGSDFPPETFTSFVGDDGKFTVSVDAAYRPPGSYRIQAYQDTPSGHVEAFTGFTVPCTTPAPTLSIDPTCGPVADGKSAAYTINLVGSGFSPGFVELVFDPKGTPFTGSVQADANGAFSAPFVVDGKSAGVYDVLARQVTVVGPLDEVSAPFLVPCELLVLRITPTTGARGFVPFIEGLGFPANTTLYLRWDFGIGASQPMKVQTDANGSFSRQVLIYQHDFLGLRHLTVQDPSDPTLYTDLSASYLVGEGTVSPPFVIDNPFGPPDPILLRR